MKKKSDTKFKEGNQRWRNIDPDKIGRDAKYETPKDLWDGVLPYFDHCDNTPIETTETKSSSKDKKETIGETKTIIHRVPYTWEGMYSFMGICNLDHYKQKTAFSGILTHIKNIIYNQKFSGAAAGIFNANIIARDLGLKDTHDLNHGGQDGNPIEFYTVKLPDNGRNKSR